MTRPPRKARPNQPAGFPLSPLARAVYRLLRQRVRRADPRVTYKELAGLLRGADAAFEHVTQRSRELYAALCEVGDACRHLDLPPLPALVVRADTRRPGDAYFTGGPFARRGERTAAWQRDLDAVRQTTYPAAPDQAPRPPSAAGRGPHPRHRHHPGRASPQPPRVFYET